MIKFYKIITKLFLIFLFVPFVSVLSVNTPTINVSSAAVDNPIHIHVTYQNDPASTITVTWQTDAPKANNIVLYDTISCEGNISLYRYSATGSNHTYNGASGYIHNVELTNLESDTTYFFICGGLGDYSKERSFRTAPPIDSDFQFVVGGDSQSDSVERVKISQAMSHFNPSFVMHVGDLVGDGRDQNDWDAWFTDVNDNWIGDNGLTIPVIPTLGNHDENATKYYRQFALPGNEQWYYYDWGPMVRIIVLNSEASPSQISADQVNWLESVLASTPDNKWKFVMFHRTVYSHSKKHDDAIDLQQNWVPVLDKYHVDIVFQGHTHQYHRTKPMNDNSVVTSYHNGTVYVTTAGWGAHFYDYDKQTYSAYGKVIHHFTLVSIYQNGTLHLEAKDINGNTFDNMWLYDDELDLDGDGLLNTVEVGTYGTDPLDADTDGDGLVDGAEVITHDTDPLDADTDGDGLEDGGEVDDYDTDPLDRDTDGDGLEDGEEVYDYDTDQLDKDTDGDGLEDGEEVDDYDTDPLDKDTDGDGLEDGEEVHDYDTDPLNPDMDGDGLKDGAELKMHGSIPTAADTDGDWLSDYDELFVHLTNVTNPDTDLDGLLDGDEVTRYGTDPTVPDTAADTDGDGLTNVVEVDQFGTNFTAADTDGDGLTDGEEISMYYTDPTVSDADVDTDGDGLLNVEEVDIYRTRPTVVDTDGDRLWDGDEVNWYRTNPIVPDADVDTDGDGLLNVEEVDIYETSPTAADTDGDTILDNVDNDPLQPDRTSPEITLNSPDNDTIHQSGFIIDLNVTDANNVNQVLYCWDGVSNQTLTSLFVIPLVNGDGQHDLRIYAQDSAGNWGTRTFMFTTDDTGPSAKFKGITQDAIVNGKFNITVMPEDANGIDHVEFFLKGICVYSTSSSPYIWIWDTTRTSDGSHVAVICIYDIAGNFGSYQYFIKILNDESGYLNRIDYFMVGVTSTIGGLIFKWYRNAVL